MSVNTQFEGYKIWREVRRSGKLYHFKRPKPNKFKEPGSPDLKQWTKAVDGSGNELDRDLVIVVKGLYHEENSHVSVVTGDTTQTRTKKLPKILCPWEEVENLRPGDTTKLNDKWFRVTGITNIQEWSIIADISLEVFDDGVVYA